MHFHFGFILYAGQSGVSVVTVLIKSSLRSETKFYIETKHIKIISLSLATISHADVGEDATEC